MKSVVIIGAGQAGGWAATTLRAEKFAGRITLLGDEPHPPYERPPLSKEVLLGTRAPESTYLWPVTKLAELDIDMKIGCPATSIDRQNKTVALSDRDTVPYDRLMLATGSRVRKLSTPGADLPRIHYMRGIADAVAISQALISGSRLLVVGGGWIGLEVAAAARQRNVDVVLVEAAAQLCSRALPVNVSHYLQQQHERNGVRILLGATVTEFCGTRHFEFAQLAGGEKIAADAAVIGVGVVPNSEIAKDAGVETNNGIVVDATGRTSDDAIYAAGDVANQPDGAGGRVRLESWSNAQNQAIAAAKAMLGSVSPYQDVPYFWSDQYAIKLQILGRFADHQDIVVRGHDESQSISFYMNADKIAAVVGVNRPQEIAVARRLMQKNIAVDRRRLVAAGSLNEILRGAAAPT